MSSPIPVPPRPAQEQAPNGAPSAPAPIELVVATDLGGKHVRDATSSSSDASLPPRTPMLLSASQTSNTSGGSTTASDCVSAASSVVRTPPGFLSDRRMSHKLVLSMEEKASFQEAIVMSKRDMKSDMARLPKSTNMGLGKNGPPAAVMGLGTGHFAAKPRSEQAPRPMQPVADHERARVMTEHERTIQAHSLHAHSWEESDAMDERRPTASARRGGAYSYDEDNGDARPFRSQAAARPGSGRATAVSNTDSKATFMRVIPSIYTSSVTNATTFYREILGFSLLGKPDVSHAALVRSPTTVARSGAGAGSYLKVAPPDSVQIYLRIAPMNSEGVRERPPPATLWIQVNDVDAVHAELQDRWARFAPRADEYFPMHSFGDARILSKPQNKAWGNREMHVVDGDENKLIFFKEIA